MQDKTLVLCRGLPGSGKTTLAKCLAGKHAFSADDFFERDGRYNWSHDLLGEAHAWCQERTREAMSQGISLIAVHNTFSKKWEAQAYFDMAQEFRYSVFVVEAQNDFGDMHSVPVKKMDEMRVRWESLVRPPLPLWKVLLLKIRGIL